MSECLSVCRSPLCSAGAVHICDPVPYFSNRLTWSAYSRSFWSRRPSTGEQPLHYGIIRWFWPISWVIAPDP